MVYAEQDAAPVGFWPQGAKDAPERQQTLKKKKAKEHKEWLILSSLLCGTIYRHLTKVQEVDGKCLCRLSFIQAIVIQS